MRNIAFAAFESTEKPVFDTIIIKYIQIFTLFYNKCSKMSTRKYQQFTFSIHVRKCSIFENAYVLTGIAFQITRHQQISPAAVLISQT